jgi:hypothetical protein
MRLERIGLLVAAGFVLGGLAVTAGCDGGEDALDDGEPALSASDLRVPWHHRGRHGGGAAGTTGSGTAGNTGAATAGNTGAATAGNTGAATTGTAGGAGNGSTTADCDLCTKAQQCCQAVQPADRPCFFNAGECSSDLSVRGCLVYLNTVRSVWGFEPPSECR